MDKLRPVDVRVVHSEPRGSYFIPFRLPLRVFICGSLEQLFRRLMEELHQEGLSLNDKTGSWESYDIALMNCVSPPSNEFPIFFAMHADYTFVECDLE